MSPWMQRDDGSGEGAGQPSNSPSPAGPADRASRDEMLRRVRRRDGDQCRCCGKLVSWQDRKGPRGGAYHHTMGAAPADYAVVVVCRKHAAAIAEGEPLGLRPVPTEPVYRKSTADWLRSPNARSREAAEEAHRRTVAWLREQNGDTSAELPGVGGESATDFNPTSESDHATDRMFLELTEERVVEFGLDGVGRLDIGIGSDTKRHRGLAAHPDFKAGTPTLLLHIEQVRGDSVQVRIGVHGGEVAIDFEEVQAASPSVGAPSGAGVTAPTVGAEEGGASASPS